MTTDRVFSTDSIRRDIKQKQNRPTMVFYRLKTRTLPPPTTSSTISTGSSVEDFSVQNLKPYDFLAKDPNYLLRLCQTCSRWRHIQRCCEILSEAFSSSSFEKLSSNVRDQLLQKDEWGNTPLHLICYHKPPSSVVEAMLKAARTAPPGGRTEAPPALCEILTTVNNKGVTPLIICCKAGASRKTIRLLLDGSAVAMSDEEGATAFRGLLNRYSMFRQVPALRHQWSELEDVKKEDLMAPGDWDQKTLNSNFVPAEIVAICCGATSTTTSNREMSKNIEHKYNGKSNNRLSPPSVPDNQTNNHVFLMAWTVCKELLRAAWQTEQEASSTLVAGEPYISDLHGAALVADALPESLSDMILRTLLLTDGDCLGSVPLPSSTTNKTTPSPLRLALVRRIGCHSVARRQHAHFLHHLLDLDPSQVAKAKRSSVLPAGWSSPHRSLICQAIVSGHYWHLLEEDSKESVDEESSPQQQLAGPVKTLFRHCPEDIIRRDGKTGLYPFMLAATVADGEEDNDVTPHGEDDNHTVDKNDTHRQQLDTIYNLLRCSPECLGR